MARQKCRGFGKNCRMTERYSKPDRWSQSRMYRTQSLASISLFHRLMERLIDCSLNLLDGCPIFGELIGGEKFSLGAMEEGGGVQGPCDGWHDGKQALLSPSQNFQTHLLSPPKPEPEPKPKQALSKGRCGKRVSGDVSFFDTSH